MSARILISILLLLLVRPCVSTSNSQVDIEKIFSKYRDSKDPKVQAKTLLAEKKYSQAYKKLAEHLKKNPADSEGYFLLGVTLENLNYRDKAEVAYKKAFDLNDHCAEALNNLACIYLDDGRLLPLALDYCEQTIKLSPNNLNFQETYAYALCKNNRSKEALTLLQNLLPKLPGSASLYYHLGLVLREFKAYGESSKALKNACLLDPSFKRAQEELTAVNTLAEAAKKATLEVMETREVFAQRESQKQTETKVQENGSFASRLSWREGSFHEDFDKGLSCFQKQDYDNAEKIWKMGLFWFEENGEISPYIMKAVRYMSLIRETRKDFQGYRTLYTISQLMNACYQSRLTKLCEEKGDYENALFRLKTLGEQLPLSMKKLYEHKEKIYNLYEYARLHGEQISLLSGGKFRDFIEGSFRDFNTDAAPDNCETFLRYCRSGDYERAYNLGRDLIQLFSNDSAFTFDYALVLAFTDRLEDSWNLLAGHPVDFYKDIYPELLALRAQLILF
ncbi:MAG: hypothetical protein PHW04_10095 [Candidatus Wallbacteria bacterium]|nr:hypothetical protein [Candidatus Wallbacteria bacterium]